MQRIDQITDLTCAATYIVGFAAISFAERQSIQICIPELEIWPIRMCKIAA